MRVLIFGDSITQGFWDTDGLHPNNESHELIFQLVQPELNKVLN